MSRRSETQLERARELLARFSPGVGDLVLKQLDEVLSDAQNPPPDGQADGSITPPVYGALRALYNETSRYHESLRETIAAMNAPRKRGRARDVKGDDTANSMTSRDRARSAKRSANAVPWSPAPRPKDRGDQQQLDSATPDDGGCSRCGGTGEDPVSRNTTCDCCGGTGVENPKVDDDLFTGDEVSEHVSPDAHHQFPPPRRPR